MSFRIRNLFITILLCLALSLNVYANPQGETVVAGSATFTSTPNTLTVNTASNKTIINYNSFSIAANEATIINQPSVSSATLNRVVGVDPSSIYGTLSSNGKLFLVNPNGILFGPNSQVNAPALLASTLNISNNDFLNGNYDFFQEKHKGSSYIINQGRLAASPGGYIALLSQEVNNQGVIIAPLGSISLASGNKLTLGLDSQSWMSVVVDDAVKDELLTPDGQSINSVIDNSGTIMANGGEVLLTAQVLNDVFNYAINNTGVIQANSLQDNGGVVEIVSSGNIASFGTLDASSLIESGNTFHVGGIFNPGNADVKNTDNAIEYTANTDVSGTITDPANIIIDPNVTLTMDADTAFDAGSAFIMNPTSTINGNDFNLSLSALNTSSLGNINNVNLLTLNLASGSIGVTYISSPSSTFDVTTLQNNPHTIFSRAEGTGTSSDPIMIYTDSNEPGGLEYIPTEGLGLDYELANNFNALNSLYLNSGAGYAPIGNSSNPFTGSFNGNNFTISDITINKPSSNYVGLFGATSSTAELSNIGLTDVNISGESYVGALVGYNDGTISNSYSTGSVSSNYNYVGGLAGYSDGTITNSYSTASVSASGGDIGGLVGFNDTAGVINNSYSTGSVSSSYNDVGGLAGYSDGAISNSYSTGNVSGDFYIGGLVGYSDTNGVISNTYSTGSVNGSDNYVGGLVGFNDGSISNSFSLTGNVNGTGNFVGGLVGQNNSDGSIINSYSGENVSGSTDVGGLVGDNQNSISNSYSTGSVNGDDGVGGLAGGSSGPISNSYSTGNVNSSGADVGGLVGGNGNTITNSYSTGNVSSSSYIVGGLVGSNTGSISASFSSGNINGANEVGGLVGENDGSVTGSSSDGSVSGGSFTGGFVGWNSSGDSIINSYSTGNVTGGGDVGGFIGINEGSISNSYSTGSVSGSSSDVGGFVGYNNSGTVSNSYSTGDVSGGDSVGGFVGYNPGIITGSFTVGNVSGADFIGGFMGSGFADDSDMFTDNTYGTDSGGNPLIPPSVGTYAPNGIPLSMYFSYKAFSEFTYPTLPEFTINLTPTPTPPPTPAPTPVTPPSSTVNSSAPQINLTFQLVSNSGLIVETFNVFSDPLGNSTALFYTPIDQGAFDSISNSSSNSSSSQISNTSQSDNSGSSASGNGGNAPSSSNNSSGTSYSGPIPQSQTITAVNTAVTPDPINIFSGEDYFSSNDFSFSAQGPKLALFRKYRSFSKLNGMFGYGWRTDFDANLTTDSKGNVIIYDEEGTGIYFMNNSGAYTSSPGNYSKIAKNADNTYTLTDKNGIVTHYDIKGRLSSRTDRNGNALTFVYDPAQDGGSYIQDAGGRKIKLYFDSNNHIISAVDPDGHTYQYGYDANGNLVSITSPTGAMTKYVYNADHKIIKFTNANNHNTYYQYDAQGRAVMNMQDNDVNKVSLNYQPENTTVVTNSLGNKNTYVFNDAGLLISHTDPLGAVTQQTWDINMNKTSITDARNNVTSFVYDSKGNLIQKTDPLGNKTKMAYTPDFNLISSITNALDQVTRFVYDVKGSLTTIIDPLGNNHSFAYDQYGNAITVTDSRGDAVSFAYDAFSHILQKTDALGDKMVFTYDANGNVLTKGDALGHITGFQYDQSNRLLKTTFADNSTVSTAYDLFGNQISVTDQRGNTLTKTYDPYERLSQTKDPNDGITQFNYDTEGHLLKLTDANGHATSYAYDPNGRVLAQSNALNFPTAFTYDKAGNILTRRDANAKTTAYTYDALNRLTNTAYPDGTFVANAYDVLGRKVSMRDPAGETTYSYDALGRLLSKTAPGTNNTISYTYDSEGNRLSSIDQNNRTVTNSYDALNRLASVTDTNGTTAYSYDADSNRVSVKSPNGISENYTYNALNRVLTTINKTAGNEVISSFVNAYDAAGMIIKKTYQDDSFTAYSYDALNRLLEETKEVGSSVIYDYVYTYDALGNRLTRTENKTLGDFWNFNTDFVPSQVLDRMTTAGLGKSANPTQQVSLVRNYNYDAANRLTNWDYAVNAGSSSFHIQTDSYSYDQNGNRLTKQVALAGQTGAPQETDYTYDFENRLKDVKYVNFPGRDGAQHDAMSYSGEGLRTQVVKDNTATDYLYDGSNVSVERDASDNTTNTYTRAVGYPGGIGGLIDETTPSTTQYFQYNDLGSVSNLTTSTGSTASSYTYDAFGNLLTSSANNDNNTHLFSTKEFDAKEGLYYFGARYYDPEIGRWLTPDPMGFADGLNVYTYVNNNPINLVDPYGFMGEAANQSVDQGTNVNQYAPTTFQTVNLAGYTLAFGGLATTFIPGLQVLGAELVGTGLGILTGNNLVHNASTNNLPGFLATAAEAGMGRIVGIGAAIIQNNPAFEAAAESLAGSLVNITAKLIGYYNNMPQLWST